MKIIIRGPRWKGHETESRPHRSRTARWYLHDLPRMKAHPTAVWQEDHQQRDIRLVGIYLRFPPSEGAPLPEAAGSLLTASLHLALSGSSGLSGCVVCTAKTGPRR